MRRSRSRSLVDDATGFIVGCRGCTNDDDDADDDDDDADDDALLTPSRSMVSRIDAADKGADDEFQYWRPATPAGFCTLNAASSMSPHCW
jgi:hypothetical protein